MFQLLQVGGGMCHPEIFYLPWTTSAPLALGCYYLYLNKIFAKMLHLSTETYINKQGF